MSEESPEAETGLADAYATFVSSKGVEGAFRAFEQLLGREKALKGKAAWERKVRIIDSQSSLTTIRRSGIGDWYAGPADDDRCWPALKKYLLEQKKWAPVTVDSLDAESTAVMKLLPHTGGEIRSKGLVVGYVQSGKTANYTALITKAADVGYRFIIVLAGIHNGLRRQTQERLQAELIELDPKLSSLWHTLTQENHDFRGSGLNPDAFLINEQRILAVVKKNYFVLDRLVNWLGKAQERSREMCPTLIIDDEADQAGLNTGKDSRSAINERILALKNSLPRSAYVGYTATPFANVLVDPSGDDLYPEDFITALNRPVGYFGTELFFGRDALGGEDEASLAAPPDMFRQITKEEVRLLRPESRAKTKDFEAGMPKSLGDAIRYFLLATCARWVRGHVRKHSSMLVHTALNPAVHQSLVDKIESEVAAIKRSLTTQKARARFAELWSSEHPRVTAEKLAPVSFDDVWAKLPEVLKRTKIVEDNGKSENRLLYKTETKLTDEDPVAHIAVGGNTLSRGLTLEGLVVSYFVRSASTYDTLLQMGRWFGYRFGYEDLPRLWMTDELRDAFHDLATVEEEVRRDIGRYAKEGLTPLDFAVRIRTHPVMAVTSRLKMQHAVPAGIDYTGFTRQTRFFVDEEDWLRKNWEAAEKLFGGLAASATTSGNGARRYSIDVPAAEIRKFIQVYRFHDDHNELHAAPLLKYIDAQNADGRCKSWTVCLVSRMSAGPGGSATFAGLDINLPTRSSKRPYAKTKVDIGTLTTQADFGVDLDPKLMAGRTEDSKAQPSRPAGTAPLLLLYPIARTVQGKRTDSSAPSAGGEVIQLAHHILGIAFAFPDVIGKRTTGTYVHVDLPRRDTYIDEEEVLPDDEDEG